MSVMCSAMAMCAVLFAAATIAAEETGVTTGAEEAVLLRQEFDLSGPRAVEPRHYRMETRLLHYAEDGTRVRRDTYGLHLTARPTEGAGVQYICRKLTAQIAEGPEVEIPALAGWSYVFRDESERIDPQGQVLGIPHDKFEGLVDSSGAPLPPEVAYTVYNSFIDFHGFCNVFARPVQGASGIQDLTTIGQKIVHAAAHTEPPVNLGSNIAEGSFFRNGEVTLEFKGLSAVGGAPCALVGYDSGESSFTMIMEPAPDTQLRAVGASHYYGDLYVELDSKWVRKATMGELVVSKMTMGDQKLANAVIERSLTIETVPEDEAVPAPAQD